MYYHVNLMKCRLLKFKRKGKEYNNNDLIVRRHVIEICLNFLKRHSQCPKYRQINISIDRLNSLPDHDILKDIEILDTDKELNVDNFGPSIQNNVKGLNTIKELFDSSNESGFHEDRCTNSSVVNPFGNTQSEKTRINEFIDSFKSNYGTVEYPSHDNEPMDEFGQSYLATMAFPSLFPTGRADPFSIVTTTKRIQLLTKAENLMFFGEMIDGELVCRFASHPRFVLWLKNIIMRHQTINQGRFFF